jgi:putative FmdB family regulatory protein
MPSYDYRCTGCHNHFEARHGMAAARPACPRCGGEPELVFLSAPAVHGHMARGRELAVRSLVPEEHHQGGHGPGCACCQ